MYSTSKRFITFRTKKTTWDDPRRRGKAPSRKDYSTVDELGPLPDGWEQRKHHDGRTFFIDHVCSDLLLKNSYKLVAQNTKQTTWEDPRIKNLMGSCPAVPYSRDYKKKYEYFRSKVKKFAITQPGTRFDIKVSFSQSIEPRAGFEILCTLTGGVSKRIR